MEETPEIVADVVSHAETNILRTAAGKDYPLNLKDNSAYFDLKELYDAGVASLKIEGRIKKFEYVYTVVNAWKKQIRSFYDKTDL